MDYDLHSTSAVRTALNLVDATGTSTGNTIDMLGFNSLEYVVISGSLSAGTYFVNFEDSDDGQNWEEVSEDLRIGDSFDFDQTVSADSNASKRVGIVSKKRFQRLEIVAAAPSGTNNFTAAAILANSLVGPTADST